MAFNVYIRLNYFVFSLYISLFVHWISTVFSLFKSTDFELSNCVRKFRIFGKKRIQTLQYYSVFTVHCYTKLPQNGERMYSGSDVNIHYGLMNSFASMIHTYVTGKEL